MRSTTYPAAWSARSLARSRSNAARVLWKRESVDLDDHALVRPQEVDLVVADPDVRRGAGSWAARISAEQPAFGLGTSERGLAAPCGCARVDRGVARSLVALPDVAPALPRSLARGRGSWRCGRDLDQGSDWGGDSNPGIEGVLEPAAAVDPYARAVVRMAACDRHVCGPVVVGWQDLPDGGRRLVTDRRVVADGEHRCHLSRPRAAERVRRGTPRGEGDGGGLPESRRSTARRPSPARARSAAVTTP